MHKSSVRCILERVDSMLKAASKLWSCICHWNNWPDSSRRMLAYRAAGLPITQDVFILTFTGSLWLVCLAIALALLATSFRFASLKTAKFLSGQPKPWTWVEITLWTVAATCQQGYLKILSTAVIIYSISDSIYHITSVTDVWMVMKYQWNDTDWGTQEYSQKHLSHCHFVYNKCCMDMPGNESRPLQWLTTSAIVWLAWLAVDRVTWYPSRFLSPTDFLQINSFALRVWLWLWWNNMNGPNIIHMTADSSVCNVF